MKLLTTKEGAKHLLSKGHTLVFFGDVLCKLKDPDTIIYSTRQMLADNQWDEYGSSIDVFLNNWEPYIDTEVVDA